MSEHANDGDADAGEAHDDLLMDHAYDGIHEYDNPLPGWWKGVFIASIIFAIGYCAFYHGPGPGQSAAEAFVEEETAAMALLAKQAATKVDDKTLARLAASAGALGPAKALFVKECTQCHKATGAGDIGPNLTDDFQKHGKTRLAVYNTIKNGVLDKGMIAWGKKLSPTELLNVSAYVVSLRGTNVAGGKAPEGEKLPAWQ